MLAAVTGGVCQLGHVTIPAVWLQTWKHASTMLWRLTQTSVTIAEVERARKQTLAIAAEFHGRPSRLWRVG